MIFAAGLGTRLKPFTENAPKALARIAGITLLEHSINYLKKFGIYDIIINVHHFADQIEHELSVNSQFGANVTISDERLAVLETGGGLKHASWYFANEQAFAVINVDVVTDLDLAKLIAAHQQNDSMATLAVMERPSSRQLLFASGGELCGWRNNNTSEVRISRPTTSNIQMAFSGIQVINPAIFNNCPFEGKFSLVDLYLHVAKTQLIKAYNHTGDTFIDVGKPESIAIAEQFLKK